MTITGRKHMLHCSCHERPTRWGPFPCKHDAPHPYTDPGCLPQPGDEAASGDGSYFHKLLLLADHLDVVADGLKMQVTEIRKLVSRDLPPTEPPTCGKCDGCGQVADTADQEPWTAWTSLPLSSSAAVIAGVVKPITCPACKGKR